MSDISPSLRAECFSEYTIPGRTRGTGSFSASMSLGMPTTAKTITRRVLQLALPSEGEVAKVGIDEWAWKKGQTSGTILVELEKQRVVQLLADRSVETSKAWLRKHPEIDLVSRDRGKLFRQAAAEGAPQAKQVVDRFHLHAACCCIQPKATRFFNGHQ
ncbi:transposase [Ktedonosporobacter rubrisoli]|uniref:transposase n=1 Tax=Ktedonosporobacter rubrisoli TaxID=2509675 RepID=UPI001F5DCC3C|nr:transposase [Ktedonosporobacter rubrisoli]